MILVDTSIWVDHINAADDTLIYLLMQERIVMHPFVMGELALGSLHAREKVLKTLAAFPTVPLGTPAETFHLIETEKLYSRGIGYVDTALLVSTRLAPGTTLWTRDKRLAQIAMELGIEANPTTLGPPIH